MRSEGHGTVPNRHAVDSSRCNCTSSTIGSVSKDFKSKYVGRILEMKVRIWSSTCSCLQVYYNVGGVLSPAC